MSNKLQEVIDKIEKRFQNMSAEEVEAFHDEADSLHYVVFPSADLDGVWICHCLELDIIGQSRVGKGPADALNQTLDMAYTTLVLLKEEGQDLDKHKAPSEWWPDKLLAEYERRREEGLKIINAMENIQCQACGHWFKRAGKCPNPDCGFRK